MILHPAIIALVAGSCLTGAILAYAAFFALRILRSWDLASGSELQLALERRTYLLSTLMSCALVFQLCSLFLFIHTADSLCPLFPGAMCAAGSLNLNRFGYPTLILKLVTFLASGLWLIVNHADSKGRDYPLIRVKYRLLLAIAPLVLAEGLLQALYFLRLHPQVITSCCGSLFGAAREGLVPAMASLPVKPSLGLLATALTGVLVCGTLSARRGKGGYLFAVAAAVAFACGVVSLVASLPLYLYALPTHHCPFCMLHHEYGHLGYLFYLSLLGGGVAGGGVGLLQPFRCVASLAGVLPGIQRRLTIAAMVFFGIFGTIAVTVVVVSPLKLG